LRPGCRGQCPDNGGKYGVCALGELRLGEQLDGMQYVQHAGRGHTEQPRLLNGFVGKRGRGDAN
jgi:hypothetical protein